MLIKNPLYSLMYEYLLDLKENKSIDINTYYKIYEKESDSFITFKCFDFKSTKNMNGVILKELKYEGILDFSYNKETGVVYVKRVPTLLIMNTKVPIFTKDLVRIIKDKIGNYQDQNNIKIVFDNPLSVFAIDEEALNIIPSIKNTNNYILLNKIMDTITKELYYINKNVVKEKERQRKLDERKEYILKKKRTVCGLDPDTYVDIENFYNDVNNRLIEVWQKRIMNINRHRDATIKKYKEYLLECGCEKSKIDEQYNYDINVIFKIIQKWKEEYYSYYEGCKNDLRSFDYYLEEIDKARFNKYYRWLAHELSDLNHPIFKGEIENADGFNNQHVYDGYKKAINLLEQIKALDAKIAYYERCITSPDLAILNFKRNECCWGSIMQFPYFIKMEQDHKKEFALETKEKFYLFMIKPGTKEIDLGKIRFFDNDRDTKRRLDKNTINGYSERLIVTVPKSLEFKHIKNLINYAFTSGKKLNFICEDFHTSLIVKKEILFKLFYSNSKFILVNIDPDYYRNYFYNQTSNKNFWHRYDYSSDYIHRRKDVYSFDGKLDIAKCILYACNEVPTLELMDQIILGDYSNIKDEKVKRFKYAYEYLLGYVEYMIIKRFEKSNGSFYEYPDFAIKNLASSISKNEDFYMDYQELEKNCVSMRGSARDIQGWIEQYQKRIR